MYKNRVAIPQLLCGLQVPGASSGSSREALNHGRQPSREHSALPATARRLAVCRAASDACHMHARVCMHCLHGVHACVLEGGVPGLRIPAGTVTRTAAWPGPSVLPTSGQGLTLCISPLPHSRPQSVFRVRSRQLCKERALGRVCTLGPLSAPL